MAMPKVLDWLDDLVAQVATNVTNIEKNTKDIATNKGLFDTHTQDDDRHWTDEDRINFDRTIHFKGYFVSLEKLKEAYATGQLGDYAIIGGSDTVWIWDDETNAWINSSEQGVVISVNGKTGEIALTKADVGLGNVDNTSDINKPISTAQQTALDLKSDRGLITAAQADSHTLRAGLYYLNEEYTVLDDSTMYWAIIVTECFRKDDTKAPRSSAQIWINFQTGADSSSKIYYRKNEFDYDTVDFRWGEFKEILSDAHLVTIANNITELQTNIKTNANDIDKLEISKANRADISYSELDAFNVASGIYYTNGDGKEILGFSANAWTVIVADSILGGNSQSQIWINVSSNSIQHMYIRRQQTSTEGETIWSEFTEVITTNTLTLEDIAKAKQYKGYYATLANLQTAYTAANAGDYAIVGETQGFYMWDAVLKQWTSVASASNGGESGAVTSVNGQTGDVLLTKANLGLDKVENTPDLEKNVYSAQMLAEAKMIDGIDFNGTANIVHYGTCNTDAAEEDKIVQCTGFNLVVGAWIAITFTETNSANIENLTLNVNSTGAKPIKSGSKSLILSEDLIENTTYLFVYDGTNYQIVNGKASDKLEIVKQNNNTLDADYRVLLSNTASDDDESGAVKKSSNFVANPATGEFKAKSFNIGNGASIQFDTTTNAIQFLIGNVVVATLDSNGTFSTNEIVENN